MIYKILYILVIIAIIDLITSKPYELFEAKNLAKYALIGLFILPVIPP